MRRRLPMFRPLLALTAALVAAIACVLSFWKLERIAVAPGRLTGATGYVSAPRDGLVARVMVAPGQQVEAGDLLLVLESRDLESSVAANEAGAKSLQADREARIARRRHLAAEVHPRECEEVRASRRAAELKLEQAEAAARAVETLGAEGLSSALQVAEIRLQRDLAKMALEEAVRAMPLLEARQRSEIDGLDAEAERLAAEIEALRVQREAAVEAIRLSSIRAPVAGTLATANLDEMEGRAVKAGEELLRIATRGPDRFEAFIDDAGRAVVAPDQQVRIRLEGYPWLIHGTLHGVVAGISERRDGDEGFPVEIGIDASTAPGPLREGMRGTARIVVEEKIALGRLFIEKVTGRAGS